VNGVKKRAYYFKECFALNWLENLTVLNVTQTREAAFSSSGEKNIREALTTAPGRFSTIVPSKRGNTKFLIGIGLLIAAIFELDLLTDSGVAIAMLYMAAIMLTPWLSSPKAPFVTAGVCTVFAILGVIYSPGEDVLHPGSTLAWNAWVNSTLSIFMIWSTAILTYQYRRGMEAPLWLASIVESSNDAIIGETLQGHITSWNKGAEQMFGYTTQESIGQLITLTYPPNRIPEEEEILAKLKRGEQIVNFETIRRRKDGQDIYVSLTISPIFDSWGHFIGASKIVRDISKQKQVESQLSIQNLTLIRQTASLKQSNEDLEQFAYIASHDLQEPLRTIHGFTQLLAERYHDRLDDEAREFIGFVTDGAERMRVLIQDLLKYSRIQAQDLKSILLNTEKVLEELLKHLHLTLEEKNACLTHDPLPIIHTDKTTFQHLLQNLITNALKFHGLDPPRIHISAQEKSNEWLFSVQDNGIGIRSEYFTRIFLPFKRLHTREEYQGTGIGLAICKRIIERQRGRIWVESEEGKGAKFSFTLPKQTKDVS
jgi:PAS domain S-box-containing protein